MQARKTMGRRGFSLIELVIVVVIIAIIGAIAIPRMSRGAAGAADSALMGNLSVLRNAIDLYQTEHGGTFPGSADITKFPDQLTKYTDNAGTTSDTKSGTFIYGPYLRKVPPLPVGAKKGSTGVAAGDAAGVGWIYNSASGTIAPNTTASEKDDSGKLYSDY